jgi:uncharacterized protein involved in high-affinity Fe2+ transport
MWNPFKSKSKIKLSEYVQAVKAEAKRLGDKHWAARLSVSPSNYTDELGWSEGVVFEVYIADNGIHYGRTIKEVIEKFRTKPKTISPITEIALDA